MDAAPSVGAAPPASRRIVWAVAAMAGGIVTAAFVGAVVVAAGGWDFDVSAALGSDWGRTARQVVEGLPLEDGRVPLGIGVLLSVPLWSWFVGVPLWKRASAGLDWRRDLGWSMRPIDVPVGLAIGVLSQLVVLPVVYLPLLEWIDRQDLEEPARNLVASADSPFDVAALIVLTVVGAPVAEEIVFRGLLFRGVADMEAGRRAATAVAVVASALIFAASHLQTLQFPGLFVIGVILAVSMQVTGRLGTAIWVHVGFNATTVVILLRDI